MASSERASVGSSRSGRGPVFWKELYWFAVICLAGFILAMVVVPPKARRYWSLLELEARLAARNAELERRVEVLKGATYSMESDPFYREAALRQVLGVKKKSEELLEREDAAGR